MQNRSPLRKFVNPEILYGTGALQLAGQYAANYNARKVLIVTDPGVIEAGWVNEIVTSLNNSGVDTALFSSVTPNPRDHEIMAGAEAYRLERCDAIIAVGGGSPMDCAKGIGIVSANNMNILEFEGIDQVPVPMPPLICVPTTAGTSADVSQFAIINNTRELVKIAIVSKSVVPDVALIDPVTTTTMPAYLTACTGMDALVHAIEAYVSTANSPLTDLHALEAVRLIHGNLVDAILSPNSLQSRDCMMLGSLTAGLAFSNASLGAVHAMAHSLGGLLDLPHGECNALLLEHVIRYNYRSSLQRYRMIASVMGIVSDDESACLESLISAIRGLRLAVGIRSSLAQKGVTRQGIPALARKAMHDACMVTNPRRPEQSEIEEIYEQAL